MFRRKEPAIPNDLLDQLLAGGDAGAALAQGGLLDALKKALTERALNAEIITTSPARTVPPTRVTATAGRP